MRSAPAAVASAALLCVLLSTAVSASNFVASMYPTPDALFFLNNLNKRLAAAGSKESIQLNELLVRARFAVIGDLDPMHEHILTLNGEITGFPQVSSMNARATHETLCPRDTMSSMSSCTHSLSSLTDSPDSPHHRTIL